MSAAPSPGPAGDDEFARRAMSLWWPVVENARWHAGKGRRGRLTSLTPLDWYTPEGSWPAVRSEVAHVAYADGGHAAYHLLVAYYPAARPGPDASAVGTLDVPGLGTVQLHDAPRDPDAMAHLLAALQRGASTPTYRCALVPGVQLDGDLTAEVMTGEQSNTSVRYGHTAMLKLFRRLEPGRNLDIEVHAALGRVGLSSTARLLGSVEGRWAAPAGDVAGSLAMLVEFLPGARDGWQQAVERCASGVDFAPDAALLGSALAGVHAGLAAAFGTSTLNGSDVAATMGSRLSAALDTAPQLAPYAQRLRETFAVLAGRRLPAQRVHGDFHLGQTLATASGWRIIDFEGEPLKAMAERVRPDSRWRDVAGMLRSFDYARSGHADPDGAAAHTWAHRAREAFVEAYEGHLDDDERAVCAAYEADKAIYEVVYEVLNRPAWVQIPLSGIARLAVDS